MQAGAWRNKTNHFQAMIWVAEQYDWDCWGLSQHLHTQKITLVKG
jgi:hypothetical protein